MNRINFLKITWLTTHLIAIFIAWWLSELDQEKIVTTFDARGRSSGSIKTSDFLFVYAIFTVMVNGLLISIYKLTDKLWPQLINIPYKQYWTSNPQRLLEGKKVTREILAAVGSFVGLVNLISLLLIFLTNSNMVSFPLEASFFLPLMFMLVFGLAAIIFGLSRPPKPR